MQDFRSVLLREARTAFKEGKIERDDYRRLFLAVFFPKLMARIETYATQLAIEEQIITADASTKAIDWDKLKEFLIEILPLILEFLRTIGAI